MSGITTKTGPKLADAVDAVCGAFPNDAAMQDAISRLKQAGFDRADISIPATFPVAATPEGMIENPDAEDDVRQSRTLQTSLAASVGAMAAAGAVIATGGAALPAVAAAVAGGLGLGAAVQGVTGASEQVRHDEREEAAAHGELLLAVTLRDTAHLPAAEAAMQSAGAVRTIRVRRQADGAGAV